jgi:hypothetical protein
MKIFLGNWNPSRQPPLHHGMVFTLASKIFLIMVFRQLPQDNLFNDLHTVNRNYFNIISALKNLRITNDLGLVKIYVW